jgi:hypothetical protein
LNAKKGIFSLINALGMTISLVAVIGFGIDLADSGYHHGCTG